MFTCDKGSELYYRDKKKRDLSLKCGLDKFYV